MLAVLVLNAVLAIAFLLPMNSGPSCLPIGIKRTDIVSAPIARPGRSSAGKVTVEQKIREIGARCRRGKLVDAKGKEIYFFRLQGCWGNPPADYQEILDRQAKELDRLGKRYRVIEMTCNPEGDLIN